MGQDRQVASTLKRQIDALVYACSQIDNEIASLEIKKQQLIKELEDIRSAIAREGKKITDLPKTINKMKENLIDKI